MRFTRLIFFGLNVALAASIVHAQEGGGPASTNPYLEGMRLVDGLRVLRYYATDDGQSQIRCGFSRLFNGASAAEEVQRFAKFTEGNRGNLNEFTLRVYLERKGILRRAPLTSEQRAVARQESLRSLAFLDQTGCFKVSGGRALYELIKQAIDQDPEFLSAGPITGGYDLEKMREQLNQKLRQANS